MILFNNKKYFLHNNFKFKIYYNINNVYICCRRSIYLSLYRNFIVNQIKVFGFSQKMLKVLTFNDV